MAGEEDQLESAGSHIPSPPLNEELLLAAKVLNAHATVLAAAGRLTEILSQMDGNGHPPSDAPSSQDLLQTALSIGKHVAEIQTQVQEVMKSLQATGAGVPLVDLPSPLMFRLQEGLLAVRRYRNVGVHDLESRVAALELAVTKLQGLLEDPDLPDETKDEIRRLIKDLGGVEYIK
ncbi:MAG TPA: hypothetical protein VEM95_03310 [Thermoplasmata archaeon]|nr:hypothetical protein [Thermoplasmata archaeon]